MHGRSLTELAASVTLDLSNWQPNIGAATAGIQMVSVPLLPAGDFSQPMVGVGAFEIAELRSSRFSYLQVKALSQCSELVGEDGFSKFSWISLLPTYKEIVISNAKEL
jgi:hypothetical protein